MVNFVGAGSGAPDLITVRGLNLLKQADVIIYAGSLVNPVLLNEKKEGCIVHNSAFMTLEEVITVMENASKAGKEIVRLHTGDPSLYGAIREQMDQLDLLEIEYATCPGVSSFSAAAATLNLEYTLPDVSQSLVITRMAGRTSVPERETIRSFAAHQCSMAIFLSTGLLTELSEELILGGYSKETPAAIVFKASWPEEKTFICTVGSLAQTAKDNHITKTALILIGETVLHRKYRRSDLYHPKFETEYRNHKKALLVVSFGTSYNETREKTIDVIEHKLASFYPDYEVRRAFTSQIIINKIKKRDGLQIDTVKEAMLKLVENGIRELIVQPTHVICGNEYDDLMAEIKPFEAEFHNITYGKPLLGKPENLEKVAKILINEMNNFEKTVNQTIDHQTAYVFMGHGSDHPENKVYQELEMCLHNLGSSQIYIGTVEGTPTLEDVMNRLQSKSIKQVILQPFMVVAGDHAIHDMASDEEDSWKAAFEKAGYQVKCVLKGLGEIEAIQDLYVQYLTN